MTRQKKKTVSRKIDPIEIGTILLILKSIGDLISLDKMIVKVIEIVRKRELPGSTKKLTQMAEHLHGGFAECKRLTKEILLILDDCEPGFGEEIVKAGNLFVSLERNKFYRLLELKRDLEKETGKLFETINDLDKFVMENDLPEFKLDEEDELLARFDDVMSLWGKGTINDMARGLKEIYRVMEKKLKNQERFHNLQ